MRIVVKETEGTDPGGSAKISLNDWLSYRIAATGARLVASASKLRETEDLFSAQITLREVVDSASELLEIMQLIESGNPAEAQFRLERLAFAGGIHRA